MRSTEAERRLIEVWGKVLVSLDGRMGSIKVEDDYKRVRIVAENSRRFNGHKRNAKAV